MPWETESVFTRRDWRRSTHWIPLGELLDRILISQSVPVVVAPLPWKTEMNSHNMSQVVAISGFVADILYGERRNRISAGVADSASTVVGRNAIEQFASVSVVDRDDGMRSKKSLDRLPHVVEVNVLIVVEMEHITLSHCYLTGIWRLFLKTRTHK